MRRLFPAAALALLLGSLELSAAISGHVIDEAGKPIAGARIRAFAVEPFDTVTARQLSATPEPVPVATAQSEANGAFRLDPKKQPVVTLVVDAAGRAPSIDDVADGTSTGALMLRPASMKKGRVTANGRPVAGALVILRDVFFAKTDERGEYSAPDPALWSASLTVIHPDFAVAQRSRSSRDPLSLDVTLESGTAVGGRVVDMAGAPVANAIIRAGNWPLAKSAEDGSFAIAHLAADVKSLRATEGKRTGAAKPGAQTIVLRPGGTITGTVRNSKDNLPVAGAKVSLRGDTPQSYAPSAITDAKGNFTFEAVPPGSTSVGVNHPLFWGDSGAVQVTEGGRADRAIAVTPFSRISGTVADEEKKPVSGARIGVSGVGLISYSAPDGTFTVRMPSIERSMTIDVAKDAYALATHGPLTLEPGEVRTGVRVVLQRGTRVEIRLVDMTGVPVAAEPLTIFRRTGSEMRGNRQPVPCNAAEPAPAPSCRTDANGKLVVHVSDGAYDVQAGGETTVPKELRAQNLGSANPELTIELERGALVEGRVIYSDGTAVTAPVHVLVHGTANPGTAVTNGAFTMKNVPAGKVLLVVRGAYPLMIESDPVEVTAPASGVVIKLPKPGRLEGRVVDKETERPITQFTIGTETRSGPRRGNTTRAFTADDGKFVLEDVPPGTYDVSVTASGYARATSNAIEVAEGEPSTVELSLERGATVVGRVTSNGQPVSGAAVSGVEARGRSSQTKHTDANGEFVLDTLAGGTQELSVRKQGFVMRTVTVNAAVGKETRADVELSRGRELQGRVVDSMGRPVADARVMHRPAAVQRSYQYSGSPVSTNVEGEFRLEGLGDEVVVVSARKEGFAEASTEVNPAAATAVTITLGRGGSISGRVTGLSPAELSSVEVYASGRGGPPAGRTSVDATGAFTIHGVADGEVTLTAQESRPPRRSVRSSPMTVAGGSAPFVELDFSSGIAVRGRVTRNGQPTAGQIHFVSTDRTNPNRATAGSELAPDGTYEIRVPSTGEYRVYVSPRGNTYGTIDSGTIAVNGSMTHDVDVRGTPLRGRVVDAATGQPLPDVMVELRSPNRGMTGYTDSAGRFVFEFVVDGTHTVRAIKDGYQTETRDVAVQGSAPDVELGLGRGELVQLRVTEAGNGRPVDAFLIFVGSPQGASAGTPQRARDGVYRYWLRPGTYSIKVSAQGFQSQVVAINVPGPAQVPVELTRASP
jgi:Carboxypeptidase regulatory-like domain